MVKSMTFCKVTRYSTKVILRSGPMLKVTCGVLAGHCECCHLWNVCLYIYLLRLPSRLLSHNTSLRLSTYRSIMLSKRGHVNNFQDDRNN